MHHPHQFNLMAKSIQDDRLRAAAASRAGKKVRSRRFNWRRTFAWPLRQDGFRRMIGRAAANLG